MSASYVVENRVRGGKVVLISVEEGKYNSTKDVYRNCKTIEQAAWVRKQIEEHKIDAQTAADAVIMLTPTPPASKVTKTETPVIARKVKPAGKKKPSQKMAVLAFLDQGGKGRPVKDLVKEVAMEFDITPANARYFVSRVWKG